MSDTVSEELSHLPEYFHYIRPVIEVQRELGGSVKPAKVRDLVFEKLGKSKKSPPPSATPCPTKIQNEMQKVKQVLVYTGYIDASQKGVWSLTEKGLATDLSDIDLWHLNDVRRKIEKAYREKRNQKLQKKASQSNEKISVPNDCRKKLSDKIQKLSPASLERICQALLRRSGFGRIIITGRTGQECFEGECIFQENPLMRTHVRFLFQFNQEPIGAEVIKNFRRSMTEVADKGILMTTGSITLDAKGEAQRDGVAPVVLVDGNKLMDMIEKLEIQLEAG